MTSVERTAVCDPKPLCSSVNGAGMEIRRFVTRHQLGRVVMQHPGKTVRSSTFLWTLRIPFTHCPGHGPNFGVSSAKAGGGGRTNPLL